jgi:hypothetical protein
MSQAGNQRESRWHDGFLLGMLFDPENGSDIFLGNVG